MQAIQKFQIDRLYYPNQKCRLLQILERDGKKLTVAHIRENDNLIFDVTVNLTADEKGAYEYFIYDNERIPATNLLPKARHMSELPTEEQKFIEEAVMRHAKHYEKRSSETVTYVLPSLMKLIASAKRNAEIEIYFHTDESVLNPRIETVNAASAILPRMIIHVFHSENHIPEVLESLKAHYPELPWQLHCPNEQIDCDAIFNYSF